MEIYSTSIRITAKGFCDIQDITVGVRNFIRESNITQGLITAFVPGLTAAITTLEFEEGVIEDFKRAIERLAPKDIHYEHNARWGDGNGFSHVRAALLGPSLTVPIIDGSLELGTWQQIIVVDFDNRPRTREVILQIVGNPRS
ncbi:MAG: secondary thiamine-phosphate synthase enzyme [Chlorobiaceae bacterium]|nr:secondary thiamine-phosphate synthase enzyme [Chlorobiaceae bacterium]